MEGKARITPGTLRPGQKKVVTYTGKDGTVIIVPDPLWDGVGDLSKLPQPFKGKVTHYSKNGFKKGETVVDANASMDDQLHGRKVIEDINKQDYSIDDRKVSWQELDSRGNRLS